MPTARVPTTDIDIAYDTVGPADGRPLLLVMGLGAQLIAWNPEFCLALAERGFRVIRFDNRDVGLSTHLSSAPMPNLLAALMGDTSSAAYSLEDMARDGFGLLDVLGVEGAHIVGASLGGMIVQTMAILDPDRVLSMTSIMSTPDPMISNPKPAAQAALMRPPPTTRDQAVQRSIELSRIVASPAQPIDEKWCAELGGAVWDRGLDPMGVLRQTMAIYASGDRTALLRGLPVPTLVIHGEDDPLINVSAGRATAALIPAAELLVLPAMGHDLPRAHWPVIVDAIARTADRSTT